MDKHRTDEERATIARGWRASGLPQDAYAAQFEVSARTLRAWLREWAPCAVAPDDAAAKIIEDAVSKLRAVLGCMRAASAQGTNCAAEAEAPVPMPNA